MLFLDEKKIEFPCPDSATARACQGKMALTFRMHRIARGLGAFVISVNPALCRCDTCTRTFRIKRSDPSWPLEDIHFSQAQ